MTAPTPTTLRRRRLEAAILDYNGVLGVQPSPTQWRGLAELAGWPAQEAAAFQKAFWKRRTAYDEGTITTHVFWDGLLRGGLSARPGSALLAELTHADTQMWTTIDPAVLEVLHAAHRAGTPLVLLSNAPRPLAAALDATDWCATLFTKTVYSARIGVNKPHRRAYEAALAVAGWPSPEQTLFVDDRADNVEAAARLGLLSSHYTGDPGELARHLTQPAGQLARRP
ncbi:HAD family phosphatase [Streptomyces sp. NBC_01142]|uniref:HAD family hydrolase n=1 Tax=Streptomyces sp. NBC_01142 TaxID=2975865 RepID=UPI002258839F|nr:HAD family phosphatase [Streptomyces sp. NBC_01142]MCX4826564.1 HAD family phosphatase [Streptomyces sp. NBC_01142]